MTENEQTKLARIPDIQTGWKVIGTKIIILLSECKTEHEIKKWEEWKKNQQHPSQCKIEEKFEMKQGTKKNIRIIKAKRPTSFGGFFSRST